MNREWHEAHPMPANPTLEERLDWHLGHAAACPCRRVTAGLVQRIRAQAARRPDGGEALRKRLERLEGWVA